MNRNFRQWYKGLRQHIRTETHGEIDPGHMVYLIVILFIIAALGAAFAPTLQTQVTKWSANLTGASAPAATVVSLIPMLFWILLAAGLILSFVGLVEARKSV